MDTRRLILVLIFTFSSFMLWENWQKYNQPKPAADAVASAPVAGGAPTPSAALQAKAAPGTPPRPGAAPPTPHAASLVAAPTTHLRHSWLLRVRFVQPRVTQMRG